jgi:FkbM family methyltransferase
MLPKSVRHFINYQREKWFFSDHRSKSRVEIREIDGFKVAFRSATVDEDVISSHAFDHDIFFEAIPEYRPSANDVIIDVGSHIGTFAVKAASYASDGVVIALEPSRESFCLLEINAALNGQKCIKPLQRALADKCGEVTLYHSPGNWGHSITRRLSGSFEVVPSVSIASLFEEFGLDSVQLMKFNCEGAEFPAILAAPAETLARVDRMIVLYHCDMHRGAKVEELEARLREAGFEIEYRNRDSDRGWILARQPRVLNR